MVKKAQNISFIVPVYNEAEVIENFLNKMLLPEIQKIAKLFYFLNLQYNLGIHFVVK